MSSQNDTTYSRFVVSSEFIHHPFSCSDGRSLTISTFPRNPQVETVGDSYIACTGIPEDQPRHALLIAEFAWECHQCFFALCKKLESVLGPETTELGLSKYHLSSAGDRIVTHEQHTVDRNRGPQRSGYCRCAAWRAGSFPAFWRHSEQCSQNGKVTSHTSPSRADFLNCLTLFALFE